MSWIVAIIVGGIIGAIASAIMRARQNYFLDIVTGIIGAVLARWFFGTVLGIGSALTAGAFSAMGILWGIIGAIILIAIVRGIMSLYGGEERTTGTAYHEEIHRRRDDDDEKNRRY